MAPGVGFRIITFATLELAAFTRNWLCCGHRVLPPSAFTVFAADFSCSMLGELHGSACEERATGARRTRRVNAPVIYKSRAYLSFFAWRIKETRRIVESATEGERILFVDVDVVLRADPSPALAALDGEAFAVFARDRCRGNWLNGGFFAVRAGNASRAFMQQAEILLRRGKTYDGGDQGAYQNLVHRVTLLSCSMVAPGSEIAHRAEVGQTAFHFNWISNSSVKRECMEGAGWWIERGGGCASSLALEYGAGEMRVRRDRIGRVQGCDRARGAGGVELV